VRDSPPDWIMQAELEKRPVGSDVIVHDLSALLNRPDARLT
jgi:hypothetical protein